MPFSDTRCVRVGDRVQYVGSDLPDEQMWEGHPGRIIDDGLWPTEVAVAFVNGATVCMPPDQLRLIDEAEYARLGHRTAGCTHPLRDEAIPRVTVEGQEWPDGPAPPPATI